MKILRITFVFFALAGAAQSQWIKHTVSTTESFRGLSVVSEKVVWASGTGGTVIKTTDGGKSWKVMTVPGADKLDFRDIEAFDSKTAYVLSIGNGEASRIYKTTDGGEEWTEQFHNKDEKAFYDAIACWDRKNCIAMSDPVGGHFLVLSTSDGGDTWKQIVSSNLPHAKEGEAAFAASGTCLYISPKGVAYLVSGGNDARVFRSTDRGVTWIVANTPILRGTAGSGIFSIAMLDEKTGVIVGGNYEKPDERNDTFAMTVDEGEHWKLGARPNGFRSGVVYLDKNIVIAVGTNGSDISYGRGVTWEKLGKENLNAVDAKGRNAVWAVGPNGNVFQLDSSSLNGSGAGTNNSSYHSVNVSGVGLSHSIIAKACTSLEKACSNSVMIEVRATGPDMEAPHEYAYIVSAGKVVGDGPTVKWDLTGVKPGKHTITAGIRIPFLRGAYWDLGGTTRTEQVVVR